MEDEHRRKRVRKRRKVRCQFSSDEVSVCTGCLARGTSCVSQEFPEDHDSASGGAYSIGERLGRVELLLEKIVTKIESYERDEECQALPSPERLGTDVLTPSQHDNAPVLSLFDNVMIGRRNVTPKDPEHSIPTPSSVHSGNKTPQCRPPSKIERIRQTLADLLPCQKDADLISSESFSILIIHAISPHIGAFSEQNIKNISSTFNMTEVSKQHPTYIARTLLYIAVSIQQLPSDFDFSKLSLVPSAEARIEKYMATIQALVIADDELVCSLLGLECLLLQGLFHTNAGSLRRSWLAFRRALNVGQLMGIHRPEYSNSPQAIPGGSQMWHHIVRADRYLGLLLGLPFGSSDNTFGPDETFDNPKIDKDELYNRNLSIIAGGVMERNQTEYTHAFATTQELDEKLENLAREMPDSWWEVPQAFISDRSVECIDLFDRLMTHFWHYQLEALLHLPFMLRASTERRYEYSKFSCLKASREMIYRYLLLRCSPSGTFCCKTIDFSAFTAAVTLFLGLLEPGQKMETSDDRQQRETDQALVKAVADGMEKLATEKKDLLAAQSAEVIRTLLAIRNSRSHSGNLRLTIPYFGTISISCTPPSSNETPKNSISVSNQQAVMNHQVPDQQWPSEDLSCSQNPFAVPVVSFMSSQFPPVVGDPLNPLEGWQSQEAENMYFDSLLNIDLESNWKF
ncbi:hypothetical protein B7463_g2980, partial [Scytalidium lignicola]